MITYHVPNIAVAVITKANKVHWSDFKVLIIEDDDLYFEGLQRHFKRSGAHVFHAMSLKAAMIALQDHEFDLIVIDLGLPDFGSKKEDDLTRILVLDTLIDNSPSSEHVVITGRFSNIEAEECRKRGAKGYLAKSRLNGPTLASLFDRMSSSDFILHSGNIVMSNITTDNPDLTLAEEECLRWVEQRPSGMKRNELFVLMARHFGLKTPSIAEQKYKRARRKVITSNQLKNVDSNKSSRARDE